MSEITGAVPFWQPRVSEQYSLPLQNNPSMHTLSFAVCVMVSVASLQSSEVQLTESVALIGTWTTELFCSLHESAVQNNSSLTTGDWFADMQPKVKSQTSGPLHHNPSWQTVWFFKCMTTSRVSLQTSRVQLTLSLKTVSRGIPGWQLPEAQVSNPSHQRPLSQLVAFNESRTQAASLQV